MCVNRSKICLSFTASSVSFILETAVMCNYWYVCHVLLNSAPRYINAKRPGSHFSLALFTSMTVLHRRKPDEERERTEERKQYGPKVCKPPFGFPDLLTAASPSCHFRGQTLLHLGNYCCSDDIPDR